MNTLTIEIIAGLAFLILIATAVVLTIAIGYFLWKIVSGMAELRRSIENFGSDLSASIKDGVSAQDKTVTSLCEAIDKQAFIQERSAKEIQAILDLPKHVLAYAKMAAALVSEIRKFRQSVDEFRGVVLRVGGKKMEGLILPDEEEASKIFEIQSLIANDPQMTEEEARTKVEESYSREMQMSLD